MGPNGRLSINDSTDFLSEGLMFANQRDSQRASKIENDRERLQ